MRTVDTVLFDKTGTLTKGEPAVEDIAVASDIAAEQELALAAAVESDSEHPIARAIMRAAEERDLAVPTASGFDSEPGVGVRAHVQDSEVHVGGVYLLERADLTPPDET